MGLDKFGMARLLAWALSFLLAIFVFLNSQDVEAAIDNHVVITKCDFDYSKDISLKGESLELWSEEVPSLNSQKEYAYSLVFMLSSQQVYRKAIMKKSSDGQKFQSVDLLDSISFKTVTLNTSGSCAATGHYELSIVPPSVDAAYELICHDMLQAEFIKVVGKAPADL